MAVVELSVLAVLAAVQTCVRGTARQEDRTDQESARPGLAQPGSWAGGGLATTTTSHQAGDLTYNLTLLAGCPRLSQTVPDCHSLSEGFSKVHNTPVINTGGTLLTQRRLEMQDFILGIIYLNKDMISKQV